MSEFAWFKLLVRLVGLLLMGLSVPMLMWYIGRFLAASIPGSPARTSGSFNFEWYNTLPAVLSYGAQAAFGAYLFFRGDWVIRKVLSEIHGRCAACGFDLSGTTGGSCPECNTPIRRAKGSEDAKPPETV